MSATGGRAIITLLSDYGQADEFVGVLHGVIARIDPDALVIDLSHGVPPQNIYAGAAMLAHALPYLPVGVHVGIVDPTVGSGRRAVALRLADGRTLIGPDNGLLWPAAEAAGGVIEAVEISESPWRLEPVSATFHGRDIFAPVAAHLAAGAPLERAGMALAAYELVRLVPPPVWTSPGTLVATVVAVDGFGNVQLGVERSQLDLALDGPLHVEADSGVTLPARFVRTFSDGAESELLLYEDAAWQLALAINCGNAAAALDLQSGDRVRITTAPAA